MGKPGRSTAVVLLSGGLDSATVLALARRDGFDCYALTFDYGQRHRFELSAAETVALSVGVREHRVVRIDLRSLGGSALTDDIPVPKDRREEERAGMIPATYVPARNTIFLSYALAWAEVLGCGDIFLGVNAVDYSGYPDCRPEYVRAFEAMANLATRSAVEGRIRLRVHAPLMDLKKPDIIRLGLGAGVDYARTHSCYDPSTGGAPCLRCDACRIRLGAFESLGMVDPLSERYGLGRAGASA